MYVCTGFEMLKVEEPTILLDTVGFSLPSSIQYHRNHTFQAGHFASRLHSNRLLVASAGMG